MSERRINAGHSAPSYSVGVWDADAQGYNRPSDMDAPNFNLTLAGLRTAIRELRREYGYSCYRVLWPDGSRDSDWRILVERTDGQDVSEILKRWER